MKCDLGVDFYDTLKAENHILAIVSRANGMIGWVVRNFISRKANVVLKIYNTLKRYLSDHLPC